MFAVKTLAGHAPCAGSERTFPTSASLWRLLVFLGLWLHPCSPSLPPSSHGHPSGFFSLYKMDTLVLDLGPTLVHYPWRRRRQPTPVMLAKHPMDSGACGLQPLGSHRAGQDWVTKQQQPTIFTLTVTSVETLFQIRSPCGITGDMRFGWPLFQFGALITKGASRS